MKKYRELASCITDLMAEHDRYVAAYLKNRGIDYKGFRDRMLKYLEERERRGDGEKKAVRSRQ